MTAPLLRRAALAAALSTAVLAQAQGVAYVSSEKDDALAIVDLKTLSVTGTLPSCKRPRHLQRIGDGSRMLVERSLSAIHDRDERMVGTVMVLRDITESRALSSRMTYLAHHDALTGLPNRLQLNERLGQAITHATNHGNGIAVLEINGNEASLKDGAAISLSGCGMASN